MPRRFGMNDVFGLGQSSIAPLVLDRFPATAGSWSFGRRKRRGWLGPVGTLYRTSDGVEIPVFGQGRWGLVGTRFVRAFNGWNLLARSNAFGTSPWQLNKATFVGNQATLPNGRPAGLLSADGTSDQHYVSQLAVPSSRRVTFRVLVKRNTANFVHVLCTFNQIFAQFNLATGVLQHSSAGTGTLHSATATSRGDGWLELLVSFTQPSGTVQNLRVYPLESAINNAVASEASTASLFIGEAQLEVASTFTVYEERGATGAGDVLWSRTFDQSGNGRHFEQANAALMPYASRGGVPVTENGVLAAEFVASEGRRMQVANSTAAFNFLHQTGAVLLAIARANNTAAAKQIIRNYNSSTGSGIEWRRNAAEQLEIFAQRIGGGTPSTGYSINVTNATSASTANAIIVASIDPDNATAANRYVAWQNGTLLAGSNLESGTPAQENAQANLTLGASPVGGEPWDGTISDLDIVSGSLATTEKQLYERDAARLWGLVVA